MQQKYCRSRAALALLLMAACCSLLTVAAASAADAEIDDFDDAVVEDVQEEDVGLAADEHVYESPLIEKHKFNFADHFDNTEASQKLWIKSQAKKDDIAEEIAKYDGIWAWESPQRIVWPQDKGLVLKSKAKHAAISARLHKQFEFKGDKPLVVQYEVTMQDGQECGGSYIKLLSAGKQTEDLKNFNDKTPYTIMFGPDKCGNDVKMHFIFRHVNPINGTVTEKHCNKPKNRLEEPFKDKLPHLYTLVLRPDNTFEIKLDHKIINEGSLLTDFKPPVNPPAEIDDPSDAKPAEWDEREKIPDPVSQKPDDWNDDAPPQIPDVSASMPDGWLEYEPDMIADPSAEKPEDWDTEIDGEWEAPLVDNPVCEKAAGCGKWKAPLITNPEYKGKWRAPMIENPNYQGKWAPRKIANPDFFEDLRPFQMTPISAVGIELWSMSNEILFDNLIITDNVDVAREFAANSFDIKRRYIDRESKTLWHRLMRHMNYKPGWWAIYFIYLLIPASCYVFYLYRRAKEESFVTKMLDLAKAYPTAWGIGLVVFAALAVIIIYLRFGKAKQQDSATTAAAAESKKTDAPQPDDEVEPAAEEDDESEGDVTVSSKQEAGDASQAEVPKAASPKKNKKSDLGNKEQDKQEDDGNEPTQTGASQRENTTKNARKRTVRKD